MKMKSLIFFTIYISFFLLLFFPSNSWTNENEPLNDFQQIQRGIELLVKNGEAEQGKFITDIGKLGDNSQIYLLQHIGHTNPLVRETIIKTFMAINTPCDVSNNAITKSFSDSNKWIRIAAIQYISKMQCADHRAALLTLLKDEKDEMVLHQVIGTVAGLKLQESSHSMKLIQDSIEHSLQNRILAAGALSHMENEFKIELLREGLNSKNPQVLRSALIAYALTRQDDDIIQIEQISKSPEPIGSLAKISIASIRLNTMKRESDKVKHLFSSLNKPEPVAFHGWIFQQLISNYYSPNIKNRLMNIAADKSHPANNLITAGLIQHRILSEHELSKIIENGGEPH